MAWKEFIMKKLLFAALCGAVFFALVLAPGSRTTASAALKSSVEESILKITFRGNPDSGGTGFVVRTPNGNNVIISNAHVCAGGEKEQRVVLSGKALARPVEMPIIEMRPDQDLCVISAPSFLPALTLGETPTLGQHVSVVGHPYLRPITLSEGYIRDMDFEVQFYSDPEEDPCTGPHQSKTKAKTWFGEVAVCASKFRSYDLDFQIYPGNSGSPLLDDNGKVVGVAFATALGMGMSNALRFEALRMILSVY